MNTQLLKSIKEKFIVSRYSDFNPSYGLLLVFNTEAILYFYKNKLYRKYFHLANGLLVDGVFLQILCRFKGLHVKRYHGPDLMTDILTKSSIDKILVGGSNANTFFIKNNLINEFYSIPFSDNYTVLLESFISQYDIYNVNNKTIIFISLGLPKQEIFSMYLINHINKNYPNKTALFTIIPIGAAADFLSGNKIRSSKFIQKIGLEWLFRLLCEPRMLPRNLNSLKGLFQFIVKG